MFDFTNTEASELVERRQAIGTECETASGEALSALEAELDAINAEMATRKAAEEKRQEIRNAVANGAGEVVVNSIDTDGVKKGFDIPLLKEVSAAVNVPVIASGGAGCAKDFLNLFKEIPDIDAGLAASIFHFGEVKISDLKEMLNKNGILVRR